MPWRKLGRFVLQALHGFYGLCDGRAFARPAMEQLDGHKARRGPGTIVHGHAAIVDNRLVRF